MLDWIHLYIFALAATATVLVATEKAHLTVVGVGLILGVCAWPGLVEPALAVQGFGNKAVVTVGALYVVGEGFLRTGAASLLAERILARTGNSEVMVTLLIMGMAALLSAFVNNILVVVTFLPVITTICRRTGIYPSRLLIPLSYASIVGGMTTLVGTSTNLLVSGVLEDLGEPKIEFFEMTPLGLVLAVTGIAYLALIGRKLLPRIPSLASQPGAQDLREYVTELTLRSGSPLVGMRVADLGKEASGPRPRVGMVVRDEVALHPPFGDTELQERDIITLSGQVGDLAELHTSKAHSSDREALSTGRKPPQETERFDPNAMSFFELATAPDASVLGKKVKNLQLKTHHDASVVGLLRRGHHIRERLSELRMTTGDVLLAFGPDSAKDSLRRSGDFHLIEGVDEKIYRREKASFALAVLGVVVLLFILGVDPVVTALLGATAMVLGSCLTIEQAQRAIHWPILIFIAGTLALSQGLRASGADVLLAQAFQDVFGPLGDRALLGALFLATVGLTELLSNNAVAVVMTPVALALGRTAGLDERALVMAVAFGASISFANPLGYKTNLLVLGPGGYRFRHFLRVGLGMDLLLALVGIMLLPWFFPLHG
ncbi:MAG: SLC13 family permease [Planctomycetota bacterium]